MTAKREQLKPAETLSSQARGDGSAGQLELLRFPRSQTQNAAKYLSQCRPAASFIADLHREPRTRPRKRSVRETSGARRQGEMHKTRLLFRSIVIDW